MHGREDLRMWWDLLIQYRQIAKLPKAELMSSTEHGLLRPYDPTKPENTKIAKLIRRRLLEWFSKKTLEPRWIAAVDNEKEALEKHILDMGKNGTVAIDPFWPIVYRTKSILLESALGIDIDSTPEKLPKLVNVSK